MKPTSIDHSSFFRWVLIIMTIIGGLTDLTPCRAAAAPLEANEVVSSALEHYPLVLEALKNLEATQGRERSARGQFDGKIKGDANARLDGFYDGDSYQGAIVKPFPFLNTEVYGGLRQSYGSFPTYEGKLQTMDEGEAFMGISLSLLRDSLIDWRRYEVRIRKEDTKQAELLLLQTKLDIQALARQAFWTWVAEGNQVEVYRGLLRLAEERMVGIEKRIKKGDLAEIYSVENNQYIVKRKAQLEQSQFEFRRAGHQLSLFYRDQDGRPQLPDTSRLPFIRAKSLETIVDREGILKRVIANSPQLKTFDSQSDQAKATESLGLNDMLPEVNLKYEVSQDRGATIPTLAQQENRLNVSIEIPFEFNKGQGKRTEGRGKRKALEYKGKLMQDRLTAQVEVLSDHLNTASSIYELTSEQVKMAEKLSAAEMRKFRAGSSDLILINLRDEQVIESRIKNIESFLSYQLQSAELNRLIAEL